ncbi:hypothetical protein VNO77_13360 [Canavalia gladiata]|uniref:Dof zinc finger protein n=1 Tax=Canavalia gladiata TaxID=3824 RepID=A0AAN9LXR9_CANGL
MVMKPIEDIVVTSTCPKGGSGVERKGRSQKEEALNCPRCHSINTKFCYYNNYSLTQPRYFCKTCRRYWTEGGSLRNIPVGGGSRKNRRSSSVSVSVSASASAYASSSSPNNNKLSHPLITPSALSHTQNPKNTIHDGQDLNLAFPVSSTTTTTTDFRNISELVQQNNNSSSSSSMSNSSTITTTSTTTAPSTSQLSALELLTGITSSTSRGLNSFMPFPVPADPSTVYTTCGFPLQDFKPTLNFSLDGIGNGYESLENVQETNGRILFPFEDLKQVSTRTTTMDQNNKEQQGGDSSTGYWTGMLGGGSW